MRSASPHHNGLGQANRVGWERPNRYTPALSKASAPVLAFGLYRHSTTDDSPQDGLCLAGDPSVFGCLPTEASRQTPETLETPEIPETSETSETPEAPETLVMPMPLSSHLGPTRHGLNARAFTLVEILIVVVILGILAAMVIPQFSNAAESSKETALKQDLFRFREQIELYRQYHNGNPPTLTDFIDQMTLASDQDGNTAALGTSGYPYGPYLPSIPRNPFTDTVPLGAGAVGTSAWYYDETTGHIAANDSADHRAW